MEKVKLPREVAEAIENHLNSKEWLAADILDLRNYGSNDIYDINPKIKAFVFEDYRTRLLILASALLNGYEVETTPEEKVRQHFENLLHAGMHSEANVIHITLDNLNIKIEGVNT